ncbi:hypothetical protein IGX29_11300 [Streptomyces sp. H28]|uniref:hypothetical protein n=1 Tax=Streptomyces sp. H28 TaxID=2775865 RepID=UPI00177D0D47|nr:hypothetical protein [Streptomyces sp. H28]MBD9732384.1 hypothetical protein [Streptomyces sp. H28]
MNAPLPARRTLIGLAVVTGASALTGCATGDEPDGKGKRPPPTPPATDTAALGEAPPAADAASAASPDRAWRYTHVPPGGQDASYHALAVTSRDDVWLLGTRGEPSIAPFLEHWDGKRWSEPEVPDELKRGDRQSVLALAAGAPGELWLARRTMDGDGRFAVFHRAGGQWQRLPDPPAVQGERWPGGATDGAWCVASGTHLWANLSGKVVHWDGQRWHVPPLAFSAAALAAAPAADGTPRAWVAGAAGTECGQGGACYPQPATARWADGAWQQIGTPAYRFPDPVPPEPSATLDTVVHEPVNERLWALGRHDFNHGEADVEPDSEDIVLTGDGTAWTKVSVPDQDRAFATATTVPDGTGGLLLDAWTRRTPDGTVHKLRAPDRLPEPSEVPEPKRRYDFKQPFDIARTCLIPGTRTVLAAGVVRFNNSSDTGDPPLRPALARYDADGAS